MAIFGGASMLRASAGPIRPWSLVPTMRTAPRSSPGRSSTSADEVRVPRRGPLLEPSNTVAPRYWRSDSGAKWLCLHLASAGLASRPSKKPRVGRVAVDGPDGVTPLGGPVVGRVQQGRVDPLQATRKPWSAVTLPYATAPAIRRSRDPRLQQTQDPDLLPRTGHEQRS